MIGRLAGAGFTAVVFLTIVGSPPTAYGGDTSPAAPVLEPVADVRLELGGFVGQRVTANIEHWLKRAPADNPGLLEMFAQRDAGPPPDLVPWAGEFVGKYLISGVQALRMSDDPALRTTLAGVVDRLVTLQADDGYLGPWPKAERLRGHWDLWGHYHVILGLLGWHEATGDRRALAAGATHRRPRLHHLPRQQLPRNRRRFRRDEHGDSPRTGAALPQPCPSRVTFAWPKRCSAISSVAATTSVPGSPAPSFIARRGPAGRACIVSRAWPSFTASPAIPRSAAHSSTTGRASVALICATRAVSRRANRPPATPT